MVPFNLKKKSAPLEHLRLSSHDQDQNESIKSKLDMCEAHTVWHTNNKMWNTQPTDTLQIDPNHPRSRKFARRKQRMIALRSALLLPWCLYVCLYKCAMTNVTIKQSNSIAEVNVMHGKFTSLSLSKQIRTLRSWNQLDRLYSTLL